MFTKLVWLMIVPWTDFGINHTVLATSVLAEVPSWISGLTQMVVRLIGSRSDGSSFILLPSQPEREGLETDTEFVVIIILAWPQVGRWVKRAFSALPNRILWSRE